MPPVPLSIPMLSYLLPTVITHRCVGVPIPGSKDPGVTVVQEQQAVIRRRR